MVVVIVTMGKNNRNRVDRKTIDKLREDIHQFGKEFVETMHATIMKRDDSYSFVLIVEQLLGIRHPIPRQFRYQQAAQMNMVLNDRQERQSDIQDKNNDNNNKTKTYDRLIEKVVIFWVIKRYTTNTITITLSITITGKKRK